METSTPTATPPRPHHHRIRAAARSVSPSSVIAVTLALVLGGATVASAANGGSFLLGRANTETATATLTNTKGTPLTLSGPAGKAPLAVNQQTMVKNLNAQFLGGQPLSQLQATGGGSATIPDSNQAIDFNEEVVASTGTLPAGLYFVSATAELDVASGDVVGFCDIVDAANPFTSLSEGGAHQEGVFQAVETAVTVIPAGDALEEECFTDGANGSVANDAGIIAIRIVHQGQSSHLAGRTAAHGAAIPPGPARRPAHRQAS